MHYRAYLHDISRYVVLNQIIGGMMSSNNLVERMPPGHAPILSPGFGAYDTR